MNKLKNKNYMIISGNVDKLLTKFNTHLQLKITLQKVCLQGTYLNMLLLLLSLFSHVQFCATPEMAARQAPCPWDSPGKNSRVGYLNIIKVIYNKSIADIKFNGEKLNAFPLRLGTSQGCLL